MYRRSSAHENSATLRSRSAERTIIQDDEEALTVDTENLVHGGDDALESAVMVESNDDSMIESTRSESARKLHRRAISHPFDTADSQGFQEDIANDMAEMEEEEHALATLPRFPPYRWQYLHGIPGNP